VNQNDQVVTDDFCECFVDLDHGFLGADSGAKLALDHAKGRFDVAPRMVVGQELVPSGYWSEINFASTKGFLHQSWLLVQGHLEV
jgi:hypothetical protein